MADDALGLRGFATVVPQNSSAGNLYQLMRTAQQGRLADRAFNQQQQVAAQKAFTDASNGLYVAKNLDPILQEAQKDSLQNAYAGMTAIHKQALQAQDFTNSATAIMDVKKNHDTFAQGLESIANSAKVIQDTILGDKDGLYNKEYVGSALRDLESKALIRDTYGKITGIDYDAAANVSKLFTQPGAYNDAVLNKKFSEQLGQIEQSNLDENSSAYITSSGKATAGMVQTDENGKFLYSKEGQLIPAAKPEVMALYMQGPVRQQKLEGYAKMMTPEGGDYRDYLGAAFKKFVVEPFGKFEIGKPTVNEKSAGLLGRIDQEALASNREATIDQIVYNPGKQSESLLNQAFDPDGKTRVTYINPGAEAFQGYPWGGAGVQGDQPKALKIEHREIVYPDLKHPLQGKMSEWVPVETLPLNTDEERNAAKTKLNALFNTAQPTGMAVDQGKFQKYHEARRGKGKIATGINWTTKPK